MHHKAASTRPNRSRFAAFALRVLHVPVGSKSDTLEHTVLQCLDNNSCHSESFMLHHCQMKRVPSSVFYGTAPSDPWPLLNGGNEQKHPLNFTWAGFFWRGCSAPNAGHSFLGRSGQGGTAQIAAVMWSSGHLPTPKSEPSSCTIDSPKLTKTVARCPSDHDHLPDWKAHIKLHGQPLGTWTLLAKDRVSKKTATDFEGFLRFAC